MGVEGVILAAGLSRRAGTYKMALDINGETLIERSVRGMYDTCSRIIVVGGYKIEILQKLLTKYSKVELVYNKDYEEGMFSSVKEGFRHVNEERFFFTPGDYPLISSKVYETLLQVSGDIIIPTYNCKRGHPVLMNKSAAEELLRSTDFTNLRDFINHKGFTAVPLSEEGILLDVDTEEEYQRIKNIYNNLPEGG